MNSFLSVLAKVLTWIFLIICAPFVLLIEFFKFIVSLIKKRNEERRENRKQWSEFHSVKERVPIGKNVHFSERSIYQALETTYLVKNSSSYKTVISRLSFLHDLLISFEKQSKLKDHWNSLVNSNIEIYNQTYYDRPITDKDIEAVLLPSVYLDKWAEFNDKCLYECVKKIAISQEAYILQLKTNRAKENRILNLINIVDSIKDEVYLKESQTAFEEIKQSLLEKIQRM